MDTAAGWAPCEFQMANWNVVEDEPADAILPVEYASIDIPATWGPQAYMPDEYIGGQQQLVEHYYYSAASQTTIRPSDKAGATRRHTVIDDGSKNGVTDENSSEAVDLENGGNKTRSGVVKQVVLGDFKAHMDLKEQKMHRYPASLRDLDKCYTKPRIVAIGPYNRNLENEHLKPAEMVKHVAACHCIPKGHTLEELYEAVVSAADDARSLYDKDVMAGISYQDFRDMMFFDACFLVQYMRMRSGDKIDPSLQGFMGPNTSDILRDVLLLENQIPWQVVETVMSFPAVGGPSPTTVPLNDFISKLRGCLQDHKLAIEKRIVFEWDEHYKPPHLLGLFRYYTVGRRRTTRRRIISCWCNNDTNKQKHKKRSVSASAIELAEIGIKLEANNKTVELINMDFSQWTFLNVKLSLVPLCLDRDRASYLVNMAAHELCTVESFGRTTGEEDSAVCSYLMLLAMLAYRADDVHELRERGLLQGGGGLTNEEALRFFTSLQGLRLGKCYTRIMKQIGRYKEVGNRCGWTKIYAFCYINKKTIITVITIITTTLGVIGTLVSIRKAL